MNNIAKEAAEAAKDSAKDWEPWTQNHCPSHIRWSRECYESGYVSGYIEGHTRASSADKERIEELSDWRNEAEGKLIECGKVIGDLTAQLSEAQQEIGRLTGLLNGNPEEAVSALNPQPMSPDERASISEFYKSEGRV